MNHADIPPAFQCRDFVQPFTFIDLISPIILSTMPLQVLPATEADMSYTCNIILDAITDPAHGTANLEWINATWPANQTPAGRAAAQQRNLDAYRALPPNSIMKVVNTDLPDTGPYGNIVATSLFTHTPHPPPPIPPLYNATWPSADEEHYARHLHRQGMALRWQLYELVGGPCMTLQMLVVAPGRQRGGAGTLLLEEGLRRVDSAGVPCTVDSTPLAKRLYERFGFDVVRDTSLEVPERWAQRPRVRYITMLRTARGPGEMGFDVRAWSTSTF